MTGIVNKVYCRCWKWFREADKTKFPTHSWWFLKRCPCCVIYIRKCRLWQIFPWQVFKKTQLHWSVSIFINVLLRSTKENAYYSTLVPAGFTKVPRVLLWMTYDFTVWTPSWTDWLAAIFSLDLMFFSSIMCRARHWRAFVYWRGLFIRKSVFAVRFHFSFLCRKSCTQISRYTVMLTMC